MGKGTYPDLERRMELLWGARGRPGRGPKPALSVERIVAAAVEITEADGLPALSMRRIAERLGFTTMSLYRYVESKEDVLNLMLDTALGDPPVLDAVGGGWRPKLERWARDEWAVLHRWPWALELTSSRRLMGPHQMAWLEAGLGAIDGIGLDDDEMLEVVALVDAYVRGAAQISVSAIRDEKQSGVNEAAWWAAVGGRLGDFLDPARYPILRRVMTGGSFGEGDVEGASEGPLSLEFGLPRLLDGIERYVVSRVT